MIVTDNLGSVGRFLERFETLFQDFLQNPNIEISHYSINDVIDYIYRTYDEILDEYSGRIVERAAILLVPIVCQRIQAMDHFPDPDTYEELLDQICEDEGKKIIRNMKLQLNKQKKETERWMRTQNKS